MKRILIVCLSLCQFLIGIGQDERLDSLQSRLIHENDSVAIQTMLEIASIYKWKSLRQHNNREHVNRLQDYAEKVYEMALQQNDTSSLLASLKFQLWCDRKKRNRKRASAHKQQFQTISATFGYDLASLHETRRKNLEIPQKSLFDICWVLPDQEHQWEIDSILLGGKSPSFIIQDQAASVLKNPSKFPGTIWLKIRLRNSTSSPIVGTFHLGRNKRTWKEIHIYLVDSDKTYEHLKTGIGMADGERNMPGTNSHFQVSIPSLDERVMFVQLRGIDPQSPPSDLALTHIDYHTSLRVFSQRRHVNGIFQGVILIQLLFFLLLFFTTKDWNYGYYSVYIGGLTIFTLTLNYYLEFSLNQHVSPLILYMLGIWMATVGILKFSSSYLKFDKILPRWEQPLWVFILVFSILCFAFLLFGFFFSFDDLNSVGSFSIALIFGVLSGLITLMIIGAVCFLIIWGIQAWRRNYEPALYYLIASFFLLLGIFVPLILSIINSSSPTFDLFPTEVLITIFQAGVVLQLSCFALAVGHTRNRLVRSQREALTQRLELQKKINAATERFVPYEFLTSLGRDSILEVNLGDQVEKEVTVFFADIRDYTRIAETMTPKENFSFLNAYLGRVGPVIKANRGFVNQYYGDGIMALFMSSDAEVNSPRDALETAIEVQQIIREYSASRVQKQRFPLRIGIGIHSGPLMLGVLGDEERMDVGVVSDAVNTASRMEGLTKHFGASILVSETTLFGIDNPTDFQYRFLGLVKVKGKKDPISVYEFFEGDRVELAEKKAKTLSIFEEGLTAYFARNFETACASFESVLKQNPEDQVAKLYLSRSQDLIKSGVPHGWTGIEKW